MAFVRHCRVTSQGEAVPEPADAAATAASPGTNRTVRAAGPDPLVKSRQRVSDHGEVFTPPWLVEAMLDLVKAETERIDARFLEPACGSGNFLVPVLQRKLAAVDARYARSEFERRHYALLGLMCIYGIELLDDNVARCRTVLLNCFAAHLNLTPSDELWHAARYVLLLNIVHGDALQMQTVETERQVARAITFVEWGYLGGGRFQRRDFRQADLATASAAGAQTSFLADLARHPSVTPADTADAPLTIAALAALAPGGTQ